MDLELWKIVALSVIQGTTEFLPISSSGHLVVATSWLSPGSDNPDQISDLNIVLHVGTLGSILLFYSQRIMRLLGEDAQVVPKLMLATVPSMVVGLSLKLLVPDTIRSLILDNGLVAGFLLPVTGLILLFGSRPKPHSMEYQQMTFWQALAMGIAQAGAILPGISRSGTTITAGLRLGLTPDSAATFSFLMAIPVIAGAGLLEILSLVRDLGTNVEQTTPWSALLLGMSVSFVVGYLALRWLANWLQQGRFHLFAWWCFLLGFSVIAWQLLGQ